MSHPRSDIRQAFKAALVNKTAAGSRVWTNRPNPLSQQPSAMGSDRELPAILVYTRDERSELFDESPRRYRRTADLVVEAAIEIGPATALDDDLDSFAETVEDLILGDDTLGGTANDTVLTGTTMTIADTGSKLIGAVILTFEVEYFTYAVDPQVASLDDLSTVETQYSLDGNQPDSADRAITLLEDLEQ